MSSLSLGLCPFVYVLCNNVIHSPETHWRFLLPLFRTTTIAWSTKNPPLKWMSLFGHFGHFLLLTLCSSPLVVPYNASKSLFCSGRRSVSAWHFVRAKPAAGAGLSPSRPDTTLARLKRLALEFMREDNGTGWKTRHGFVGLVILWCIAVRKA